MSFHNLPPTWNDQPLSDPALAADVVDLVVSLGDRQRGTFTVVICDSKDRYVAAVAIDLPSEFKHLMPTLQPSELCSTALGVVMPAVRTAPGAGLLLALGRPGPDFWPEIDSEWAEAATHICSAAQVRLLGFHIASAHHIYRPLVATRAAA
jgi:hypothetical protein